MLDKLDSYDGVMVDKGFRIEAECLQVNLCNFVLYLCCTDSSIYTVIYFLILAKSTTNKTSLSASKAANEPNGCLGNSKHCQSQSSCGESYSEATRI